MAAWKKLGVIIINQKKHPKKIWADATLNKSPVAVYKNLGRFYMHSKRIPVMKTGFSLWRFSRWEKPVFITGNPDFIAGIPVMKTGFSPWWQNQLFVPEYKVFMVLLRIDNFEKRVVLQSNQAVKFDFKEYFFGSK